MSENFNTPGALIPVAGTQSALAVTAAAALTIPAGANYAAVTAIGGAVNYSLNGDFTPTATVGAPLAEGQQILIKGYATMAEAKFIAATGSTATLFVQYFA